jgi:polyisoprenyl-phosphate glycosyltransferase
VHVISIIIPVYNEEDNILPVCEELDRYVKDDYEVIFVDDGSKDNTLSNIEALSFKDSRIKCISLSRNFGHQNALMAGIQHCDADFIILMDGDGQHPPSLIPQMLQKLKEGYDLVHTKRSTTQNIGTGKKILSALFYRFINFISDTRIEPNVADFKAFNRKVLESILEFKERELFLRGIFSWIGFNTSTIDFDAPARLHGKTKYSFTRMLTFALKGTTSFSFKPLRVALFIGSIISLLAFAFAIYALVTYYQGNTVPGWASLIIAIMLLGGTQLLAIGLLGEYIASLFTETKKRPLYLVNKTINYK